MDIGATSVRVYHRQTLLKYKIHTTTKLHDDLQELLRVLCLMRGPGLQSSVLPDAGARGRGRRKWCARKRKRGKRAGVHSRLKTNPSRMALPSILLSNICSLDNKLDYIHLQQTTQRELTWLSDRVPDAAIQLDGLASFRADRNAAVRTNAEEALCELYGAMSELQNAHPDGLFIVAGDFNHANLKTVLPKFHQYVDFATRGANILDLVYTNIPGAYRAEPRPHLGYSDHIFVMLIPAYRPLVRRTKPLQKQVKTWPAGAISALQDCFECTD